MTKAQYPECEKLNAASNESNKIGAFIEWLSSQGLTICKLSEELDAYYPNRDSIEDLLAKYFDVDLRRVEKERRQILARLQKK